ncbi:MAG: SET domain-containing protein-lysine N-methyltransferase [bacterium]|nr:SET domain-containing protein-lysine N-methyltransferase [bacterium]
MSQTLTVKKPVAYENYSERVYVDESAIHGRGLFARVPLKSGDYIGSYEGPEAQRNGSHVLWAETEEGDTVGISGRNSLRFTNHSLNPNAEFEGFDLYATARIPVDQEITVHYGDDWLEIE